MCVVICGNCGFEGNIYGEKKCTKCDTELYYADEGDFDEKEIERLNREQEKIISTIENNKEISKQVENCKITTSNTLEGYEVLEYLDIVSEEKIVGIGLKTHFKSIGDMFATFTGEEMKAYTNRIKELKKQIKKDLKRQAVKIGANAIIGVDIETTVPAANAIMVSINGTAVKIKKE
ncbi:MAG: YbjQ family protein [Clostridium sp.]